jgi:hypothetical protein
MRLLAAFVCAVLLTCLGGVSGHAENRVALVIGNGAYRNAPALTNPKNDAEDVGRSLKGLSFDTIVAADLDRSGMNEALDRFSRWSPTPTLPSSTIPGTACSSPARTTCCRSMQSLPPPTT